MEYVQFSCSVFFIVCDYKNVSTLNFIAKCDKILSRDKTAQRMLFQLNYLSGIFYVSSFNFYSLFSLQILRFVYSLFLVFYFISIFFYFMCAIHMLFILLYGKDELEKSMDNLLINKTDVTQFLYTRNYQQFSVISSLYWSLTHYVIYFYYYMVKVLNSLRST